MTKQGTTVPDTPNPGTTVPIAQMRNLGPAMQSWLADVDIHNAAELRQIGPVPAYQRLKFRFGKNVNILALYAMHASLLDIDWRDIDAATKAQLKSALG